MKKNNRRWLVGIAKIYFPIDSKVISEFMEVVPVLATDRTEAAKKVWAANGERWLEMMGPAKTSKRIVRLHVSYPGGRWLGRLEPIKVYEGV